MSSNAVFTVKTALQKTRKKQNTKTMKETVSGKRYQHVLSAGKRLRNRVRIPIINAIQCKPKGAEGEKKDERNRNTGNDPELERSI